jgi:hypothetical protein
MEQGYRGGCGAPGQGLGSGGGIQALSSQIRLDPGMHGRISRRGRDALFRGRNIVRLKVLCLVLVISGNA